MFASEVINKKNTELVAFVKEELGENAPGDIDTMERPVLIELAKSLAEKKEKPAKEPKKEEKAPVVAPEISAELDALDTLRSMGFDGKDQVKAYLKGVEREKKLSLERLATIEEAQKALDLREAKLKKREQDIDAKGKKVLEDLLELRKVRDHNSELLKQREALSKLS
jgi:hypothetical protein